MDREPLEAKPTKTWFVYDKRTGKVVHIHQFVPAQPGGTCSDREMEETALNLAPAAWNRSQLSILQHDKELALHPEHRYRVDIKKRALVVEPAPPQPAQARRSKAKRTSKPRSRGA